MAWPKNLNHVGCYGFDRKYLQLIVDAMNAKQVVWGKTSMFIDLCNADFTWASPKWHMIEMTETVQSIKLLDKVLIEENLTAAVLKGF